MWLPNPTPNLWLSSTAKVATGPAQSLTDFARVRDAPLHIVLVEPQIPPNTGNVARLCAATGCALHLVEPLGFSLNDRELKRAGLDYWYELGVVMHPSYSEFAKETSGAHLWYFSTRASRRHDSANFSHGDMLVFGKETAGLPEATIRASGEQALRIPIRAGVRSLNLSTAVGIAAYAALAALQYPNLR